MKFLVAATLSVLSAFSMAQAATMVVDINSRPSDNGVTVTLDAGVYELSFVEGMYDAWNAWGRNSGCDSNGENCSRGWLTNVNVIAEGTEYFLGRHGRYATPELALDNASPFTLTLTAMADVLFYIADSHYGDNKGGISMQIASVSTAVPVPAAAALFIGGVAAFGAARRRANAS